MKRTVFLMILMAWVVACPAQFSAPKRAYVEYLIAPDHLDRNYELGEEARVNIEAYAGGIPVDGVWVYYRIGKELLLPERKDSVRFANGRAVVPVGTLHEPGFLAADISFRIEGKYYKDLVKVGFMPWQIRTFATMPNDFLSFWKKALKEAERTPMQPEVIPIRRLSTDKVEVSLVCLTVGKNGRKMYGYMSKPRDGKKHPVLFNPPGAGSKKIVPNNYYAEHGFISVTTEIHGLNPEWSDNLYDAIRGKQTQNYNTRNIEDRNSFYYKDVYTGCCRFIDFLCSLPDWDGRNVGVTGGSQGGALTIVTAALRADRITFLAPFYPALCDLTGFLHQRAGGWPRYFSKYKQARQLQADKRIVDNLQYFDVVNFARMLKAPGFYSFGYNDDTCSPSSVFSMLAEVTAPKTIEITPTSGHWRFAQTNERCMEWMLKQVIEQ